MKKIVRIFFIILSVGAAVFGTYFMYVFAPQVQAVKSIKQLAPNVYTMTYKGDYGFADFLTSGGASTDSAMAVYIGKFSSPMVSYLWRPPKNQSKNPLVAPRWYYAQNQAFAWDAISTTSTTDKP